MKKSVKKEDKQIDVFNISLSQIGEIEHQIRNAVSIVEKAISSKAEYRAEILLRLNAIKGIVNGISK